MNAASKWRRPAMAETIRHLRDAVGLRRSEVAAIAGLSPNYIAILEAGRAVPTIETILGLARALRVSPTVLLKKLDAPPKHRARRDGPRRAMGED